MTRKFLVIFGAEEADRLSPFNDDKPKRAKICRHKALRVQLSVAYEKTHKFGLFIRQLNLAVCALHFVGNKLYIAKINRCFLMFFTESDYKIFHFVTPFHIL